MSSPQVTCPKCSGKMILRTSARGEFYGCAKFPNCNGTRNQNGKDTSRAGTVVQTVYEPIPVLPGTSEQEDIWEYALDGRAHMIMNAGPGTGKTFTSIQYCLRAPRQYDILFCAYNSHIAAEAQGKLTASKIYNTKARTLHSAGKQLLHAEFPGLTDPDENKMQHIFESLVPMPQIGKAEWRRMLNLAETLAAHVKNYLIDWKAPDYREQMDRVIDRHDLDMSKGQWQSGDTKYAAIDLVPLALDECIRRAPVSYDFDDMIWLPIVLNLKPAQSPQVLIIDEAQDLAPNQHELIFRLLDNGRVFVVGDRRQAIYAWRGAQSSSIEKLASRLKETRRNVREFPLTITQRCATSHVALAAGLFPQCGNCGHVQAAHEGDDAGASWCSACTKESKACSDFKPSLVATSHAPKGEIINMLPEKALAEMKPGDMVICRVNRHLIATAYTLIRRNIRPVVKGRDFGKGLLQLIDTLEKAAAVIPHSNVMDKMREALRIYRVERANQLIPLGDKAKNRLQELSDKCDCMLEFLNNAKSVTELRSNIDNLFTDKPGMESNSVTLGTVHRTKGLEAARVFVLAPELIPHPMARTPEEIEQERNIAWIAATRAKYDLKKGEVGTLIFCGNTPEIYNPDADCVGVDDQMEPAEVEYDESLRVGGVEERLNWNDGDVQILDEPVAQANNDEPPF